MQLGSLFVKPVDPHDLIACRIRSCSEPLVRPASYRIGVLYLHIRHGVCVCVCVGGASSSKVVSLRLTSLETVRSDRKYFSAIVSSGSKMSDSVDSLSVLWDAKILVVEQTPFTVVPEVIHCSENKGKVPSSIA